MAEVNFQEFYRSKHEEWLYLVTLAQAIQRIPIVDDALSLRPTLGLDEIPTMLAGYYSDKIF